MFVVPALFLLDQNLRENSGSQLSVFGKLGKRSTKVLQALVASLLVVLAASVILFNVTLMLTVAVLIGYLTAVSAYLFAKIPQMPFEEAKTWNRIVVGETVNDKTPLKGKPKLPLFVSLTSPLPWLQMAPSTFLLPVGGTVNVDLRLTSPLVGPSKLQIQASAVDSRGLIQAAQALEPVDLHIIPRAKYAKWLAKKYLEQTTPGSGSAANVA